MVLRASISDVSVVPLQAIINKGICNGHTQRGAQRLSAERRIRDGVSLGEVRVVDELCAWLQWAKAATVHLDQAEENCRTAVTRHDAREIARRNLAQCAYNSSASLGRYSRLLPQASLRDGELGL